jgi:hypothetical protein
MVNLELDRGTDQSTLKWWDSNASFLWRVTRDNICLNKLEIWVVGSSSSQVKIKIQLNCGALLRHCCYKTIMLVWVHMMENSQYRFNGCIIMLLHNQYSWHTSTLIWNVSLSMLTSDICGWFILDLSLLRQSKDSTLFVDFVDLIKKFDLTVL